MREERIKLIVAAVKELLGYEYYVQFQEVKKNNGLLVGCIVIYEPGAEAHPLIPVDCFLDACASEDIDAHGIAAIIVDAYKNVIKDENITDVSCFFDKQYILERVVYQVINAEKNADRLSFLPHKKFLDLAVVYRVIVSEGECETSSFLVNYFLCKVCEISENELNSAARWNTEVKGFCVQSMESVFAEIMGVPEEVIKESTKEICDDVAMWVMSNSCKCNGASIMLYREYFDSLAQKLESDLYIMPSSIYEVIAVPTRMVDPGELRDMVCSTNATEVAEDEILSDNVYIYRRKDVAFSIA